MNEEQKKQVVKEAVEGINKRLDEMAEKIIENIATTNANTFVFNNKKYEMGTLVAAKFEDLLGNSMVISSGTVTEDFESDPKNWAAKLLSEILIYFLRSERKFAEVKKLAAEGIALFKANGKDEGAERILKEYANTIDKGLQGITYGIMKTSRFVIKTFETEEERLAYTNNVIETDKELVDSLNYPQKEKLN